MPADRGFRLGIIGGCLAWQPGMTPAQLYTGILGDSLYRATGVTLVPRVARYSDGEYLDRLLELTLGGPLDGVVMFVRIMTIRKTGILVKHKADGVTTYAIHPFLLRRSRDRRWDEYEKDGFRGCPRFQRREPGTEAPPLPGADDARQQAVNQPPAPAEAAYNVPVRMNQIPGISFGRISRFAGSLVGLEDWAIGDEIREMGRLRNACAEMGIPLAVFGPFPAPYAAWVERFMCRVRDRVSRAAAAMGASYVDISGGRKAAEMRFILADGIHLNEEGHRLVAGALHDPVARWIAAGRAEAPVNPGSGEG